MTQTATSTRRNLLSGAVAALTAAAAGVLSRAAPAAAEGETMRVGGDHFTATSATQLKNTTTDNDVFIATTTRAGRAVYGKSADGIGVQGRTGSVSEGGVVGITSSENGYGVLGYNDKTLIGGYLCRGANGVEGRAKTGTGVLGDSRSGTGVLADSDDGVGLYAHSAGRVAAWISATGNALALRVSGPARFSQSGVATIPAGQDSVVVPVPTLRALSFVLGSLQAYRAGIHLAAGIANPAEGTITLRTNQNVPSDTPVAWLVLVGPGQRRPA
jgi:hypothetical protein